MYKSTKLFFITFFSSLVLVNIALFGQPERTNVDYVRIYKHFETLQDPDDNLANGRVYKPERLKTYGHPYLEEDKFYNGSITVNNKLYTNLELKYDILNQYLLLNFSHSGMLKRAIIPNNDLINGFTITGRTFVKKKLPNMGELFLHEIKGDTVACYFYYHKSAEQEVEGVTFVKDINDTKINKYLYINGQYFKCNTNSAFVKRFEKKHQRTIKKQISKEKIRMRNASEREVQLLLVFCESLIMDIN